MEKRYKWFSVENVCTTSVERIVREFTEPHRWMKSRSLRSADVPAPVRCMGVLRFKFVWREGLSCRYDTSSSSVDEPASRRTLASDGDAPCPAGRGNNSALARAWRALTAFFGELPPSIYQGAPPISAAQASHAACVMQPRWLILPRWHAHVSCCGVLGWQTHARRPLIRGIPPFECVHLCCVSHAR